MQPLSIEEQQEICFECGAWCCRVIAREVQGQEAKEYFETHGLYIEEQENLLFTWVPHKCQHLDKDNKCDIYDSKPRTCNLFGTKYRKSLSKYCKLMRELHKRKQIKKGNFRVLKL